MPTKTVVVVPTYNERENVSIIAARVLALPEHIELLVVDDNSPDGTGAVADELAAANPRVKVLHRTEKNGLGKAYLAAFDWALERDYGYIFEMDADGSHQPEEIPAMIQRLDDGADLVIGARWIPGGEVRNWPAYRKAISRSGTFYARFMLRSKLHDMTAGFRGYRADALRWLVGIDIDAAGYGFQIETAWLVERSGRTISEHPALFIERVIGTSKMSTGIVIEAMWRVTQWGFADRFSKKAKSRVIAGR